MKKRYITADASDNSITLSEKICKDLQIDKGITRIFLFKIKGENSYAFKRVSKDFGEQTECGIVSYNPVLKTFGFIALCPTVNKIFYDLGIKSETKKFSIKREVLPNESIIYRLVV